MGEIDLSKETQREFERIYSKASDPRIKSILLLVQTRGIKKLSEEEINGIKNLEDIPYIKILESMTSNEVNYFNKYFCCPNCQVYMKEQIEWINDSIFYTGQHLGYKPSFEGSNNEWKNAKNSERYRVFFCLKYPKKIIHRKVA